MPNLFQHYNNYQESLHCLYIVYSYMGAVKSTVKSTSGTRAILIRVYTAIYQHMSVYLHIRNTSTITQTEPLIVNTKQLKGAERGISAQTQ